MKNFGKKFKTYQPFGIEHLAIPAKNKSQTVFLGKYNLSKDKLAELEPIRAAGAYKLKRGGERPKTLKVINKGSALNKIKRELSKAVVGVAPAANVYKISPDQKELSKVIKDTYPEFNYYLVELGLNVMLGRRLKISELLFQVELKNNGPNKTDVTAYDMAPDDKIKRVKVVGGKVSLGITKLLKLVPMPLGQVVSDLIDIEINPWEFEWGFNRYMIDACGVKNYHLYWKVYQTNIVQGFNPTMVLKVRKNVKNISARVKCIYKLQPDWWGFTSDIKTDAKEIKILPV